MPTCSEQQWARSWFWSIRFQACRGKSGMTSFEQQVISVTSGTVRYHCSGMYRYDDPGVFLTGSEFRFEIFDARGPEKVHKTVTFKADSKLIRHIRSDFGSAVDK